MANESTLTAERLRELLDYNAETGEFRRKVAVSGTRVGDIAGSTDSRGYRRICIDYTSYHAHRLAWLYVHNQWPNGELDHRNEQKDDNRIANLRIATHAQNMHNLSQPQGTNPSGYIGVTRSNKNGWRSTIRVDGKYRHLGCFKSPEEASAAYLAAKAEMHPFWAERLANLGVEP